MRKAIRVYENGNAMIVDLDNLPENRGITEQFSGPSGIARQLDEVPLTAATIEKYLHITDPKIIDAILRG